MIDPKTAGSWAEGHVAPLLNLDRRDFIRTAAARAMRR